MALPLTKRAHQHWSKVLYPGAMAVDATAGNGHDTLFLATQVGSQGQVWAFDVQEQAIAQTRKRLIEAHLLDRVTLVLDSHTTMKSRVKLYPRLIVFNLGYLPGSDKKQTTLTASTLEALDQSLSLLLPGGMLSVLAYPGHPAGVGETHAVEDWFKEKESVLQTQLFASDHLAHPKLFIAHKTH